MVNLFKEFQKNANTERKLKRLVHTLNYFRQKETQDMKFGIGDYVRIKHNITFDHKLSRTGIIKDIHYSMDGNTYFINHDNSCIMSGWKESELELLGSYKGPAEFTKADLKDGMVVEFRNGEKRIVLNDRFMSNVVSMSMSYFTDDLCHESCDGWSVDKIYSSSAVVGCRYFNNECLTLLWERKKEPTYKYKPGDKVKVRSDLISPGVYGAIGFIDPMTKFMGKTVTIVATRMTEYGDPYYLVKESSFNWSDTMFEGLVDYEEMTVEEIEKALGHPVKIVGEECTDNGSIS